MKHKNSHLLVGYWSRLRQGRGTPMQSEIDPRAIKRFLPYVFILDCEDPTRPVYRLAGTSLCERFGYELKGTNFLGHWEAQSALSLAPLLSQALKANQPLCLSSIAATADSGMAEMECVLTPLSIDGGRPTRFLGLVQMLSNPAPLLRRTIVYERLIGSQLIQEGEPRQDQVLPPPPPPAPPKSHPKAPYLRLVVSRQSPAVLNFGSGDLLQQMVHAFHRWHVANREDDSRIV